MEKKQAITLIEKTFNAKFREIQFTRFIGELLNDVEPKSNRYSGQMLWDDHKDHINSYKRIGKYIDPEGEPLDVLIVEVKTIAKLERARTSLRNFVIKHLSKFDKDYALVAFYAKEDEGTDWRFSFIKLEHQSYFDEEKDKVKIKKEFTPAKRHSFLVGEYEQSHTAKTQLLPLLQNLANNPTVADLENAFSIEKVTDEFFSQYKDLYVKLYEHFNKDSHIKAELYKANIDNARFTKKLLGQIVFLYFLQKKGWLGVPKNEKWGKGQKRFIQNLFDNCKRDKENYFKDYLQPLFYEALAKERSNEHSFYERFNCRIPFLNGGLFEAEYKWETAHITIPENLFRNQEKNKAGDIGTGVLDVFDRYNFTIKEDEPLDKEVAVDPEMLGKVFENMLEITERKSKGAFYTPREIVHYMCQESLIHYLDNSLNSSPPFKEEYPPRAGEVVETHNLNNLPYLKTFRKSLRNNLTPAEATLWKMIQGKQLDGRKFRRQHSVANYILDFYCPSEKIAIELDGQGHFEASQAEYDQERDLFLKYCGIKVLRFENKWVWENTEGLLQAVKNEFGWWKKQLSRPADTSDSIEPPRPTDTPPFKGGELLVPKVDIETYIRKGHNALENDQRVAKKGEETARYKYILPKSIRENADLIDQKLIDIKICDPAIGSGAFPVGLLHELVNAQLVLKPHLSNAYLNKKLDDFGFEFHESINESRYVYRLKRHIIQESIYGVDIDASAIDIARLRLWLSLVVEEDDLDPIETLPNLDYKIICGNSLISRYDLDIPIDNVFKEFNKKVQGGASKNHPVDDFSERANLRDGISPEVLNLIGNQEIDLAYYKQLTNDFLLEADHDKKVLFRELITEIKNAFTSTLGNKALKDLSKARGAVENLQQSDIFGNKVGTKSQINKAKKRLAKLEKEKQDTEDGALYNNAVEWRFEFPNLLDNEGDFVGFDVVIGNPPYIGISKVDYKEGLKIMNLKTYVTTGDLYVLFYEIGYKLLKGKGNVNLITSNKWINASYGSKTRSFFAKETSPQILIDFARVRIFPNATVFVNILMLEKEQPTGKVNAVAIQGKSIPTIPLSTYFEKNKIKLSIKGEDIWKISSQKGIEINKKIESLGVPLSNWKGIDFFRGITTGLNKAYHIKKDTLDAITTNEPQSKNYTYPLLRGKDIKRWGYTFQSWYMLFIPWHFPLHNDDTISTASLLAEDSFIKKHPRLYEHLNNYRPDLSKRNKDETGVRYEWYALQRYGANYWKEFLKEKIVWIEISDKANFSFDKKGHFLTNSAYFISGENLSYLISVLNSSVFDYYFFQITAKIAGGRKRYTKQYVEKVPIPQISKREQLPYELLVEYVINSKSLSNEITFSFFEQLLDAIVFELYFEQEIKQANKQVLKHLIDLKPITPLRPSGTSPQGEEQQMSEEEKLAIIQSEFERLHHPEHPVRFAVETLDSIEEVRIIKEALK